MTVRVTMPETAPISAPRIAGIGTPPVEAHTSVAAPRQMAVEIDGFRTTGNPIKMSRTPPAPARRKPPRFGEETRAVLSEIGYSDNEIEAMIAAGVALEQPRT